MPSFYVNKNAQSNGDHEVHEDTAIACSNAPHPSNRVPLGTYADCRGAVAAAKNRGYRTADGCKFCALACHTR